MQEKKKSFHSLSRTRKSPGESKYTVKLRVKKKAFIEAYSRKKRINIRQIALLLFLPIQYVLKLGAIPLELRVAYGRATPHPVLFPL